MDEYAVFLNDEIPVIAKIGSALHKKLSETGKWYVTGNIDACVKFADDVVAVLITEMEEA